MIKISEIAYVAYPVTQIARARAFYEEVLGLKVTATFGEGEQQWIEYDIGAGTLAIGNFGEQWLPAKGGPSAALEVEDFDGAIKELKDAGVKFALEPMDTPACRFGFALDPDGNAIGIHKRKHQQG